MNMQTKTKGFTIIEVVLVLAIAGLIFLMVFLALPALQRSQANNEMRAEASRILALATEYESNSNGQKVDTQGELTTIVNNAGDLKQLTGAKVYGVAASTTPPLAAGATGERDLRLLSNGQCSAADATKIATGGTNYAIQIGLIGGGTACIK